MNSSPRWNASEYLFRFNFKIPLDGGSANKAVDLFSGLEFNATQSISLKIRENSPTKQIELTTSSSDVAHEEQLFLAQAENLEESEEQPLERKEQSPQAAKESIEWVANG